MRSPKFVLRTRSWSMALLWMALLSMAPLSMALLFSACMPTPAVMHPSSVAAPFIAPIPRLVDASLVGYLRAREVTRLASRLGLDVMLTKAAEQGINLNELRATSPVVALVGTPPDDSLSSIPLAVVLPTSSDSTLTRLVSMVAPGAMLSLGDSTLLLARQPAGSTAGDVAQSLAKAPMASDVEIYLHISSLMAKYGDKLREVFAKSNTGLVEAFAKRPDKGQVDPRILAASTEWFLTKLDATESAALSLSSSDTAFDLAVQTRQKPDAGHEQSLPTRSLSGPQLARFLPAGDMRFEASLANQKFITDWLLRFYGPFLDGNPVAKARFEAAIAEMNGTGARIESGATLSIGGGISGSFIAQSEDAAGLFDAGEKMADLFAQEPFASLLAKMGKGLSIKFEKNVRQIHKWPVDRVVYQVSTDEEMRKNLGPMADLFGKPEVFETVRMGRFLITQFNGAPGSLEALAEDLLKGVSKSAPLAARTVNAPGGSFYGDIDVPAVVEHVRALMPENKRRDMPQLDSTIPRVTMFGYDAGMVGDYHMQVPRSLVDALRAAAFASGGK